MARVCVFATMSVAPGAMDQARAELLAHRTRCLRDETGTLLFELMVPRDGADALHLYEVYESQAAFDTHWKGASITELWRVMDGRLKITAATWGTPMEA